MPEPIKVGDRVAYKAAFLRAICCYSHAVASMRGTVVFVEPLGHDPRRSLVKVDFGSGVTRNILSTNLIKHGRVHLEPV